MKQLVILAIVDVATLTVLAITALILYRSGVELGQRVARVFFFLAIEIAIATGSLPLFDNVAYFVVARTAGRVIEIVGVLAFMLWLMNGRSRPE